jgi:DNA-binding MarR family transcriptional regulator
VTLGVRGAPSVPDEQVADLLVGLSRARRWLFRLGLEEPAPLGSSGVSALAEIVRTGPLRQGDLAAREGVTPPTLSRIVAGLVEHGYVERTADPDDARVQLVSATPSGRELLSNLRSRRSAELTARLGRLPEADRSVLLQAGPALRRLLEEAG